MIGLTYNIICIIDESYAQHAAVMLTSLFYQNPKKLFRIFLMTDAITENTKKSLNMLLKVMVNYILWRLIIITWELQC